MDTFHVIAEAMVGLTLVGGGLWLFRHQSRKHEATMRSLMELQSEELALQAQLVAIRRNGQVGSKCGASGNVEPARLFLKG